MGTTVAAASRQLRYAAPEPVLERAMAPVPEPWPGVRSSRAEETSDCGGLSSVLHRLPAWLWQVPRPRECFTARAACLHAVQTPSGYSSARCRLLSSVDAECGPGLAAAEDTTRSVTASLLCGAFAQHGLRVRGSDHGVPSSLHKASSSHPPSFYSFVDVLG